MIYVEDNVININRGDDGELEVPLHDENGEEYVMEPTEYLIFGVSETPTSDSQLLLNIRSDAGDNVIKFTHADTVDMDVGFYSAEIQLMKEDGKRVTVWPKLRGSSRVSKTNRKNFCLMTEVIRE